MEREENLKQFAEKWSLSLSLEILNEATTHPSFKIISPEIPDYERLETLGDAVLDLLVIEWFIDHGLDTAGTLTVARSDTVNGSTLGEIGREMGIENIVCSAPTHPVSNRICADILEAIFGALYVENGLNACRNLLNVLFLPRMKNILRHAHRGIKRWGLAEQNYRNIIDDFFKQHGKSPPEFILEWEEGSPHLKRFGYRCQVLHDGALLIGHGESTSKKQAKQEAAKDLCNQLGLLAEKNHLNGGES